MTSSSTSLALQTYEPPIRDRRVHLDDLSGVLELIVLVTLSYALRSLRRKELSLAQFTHTISMVTLLFIGGHFVEEHLLGVKKLEGLLKFGFQALTEDYTTPPRSGIVNLFRGIWELSGIFVACSGILYSRLWKCDVQHPECCPSCIASSSSISAGQGLAGMGKGPVHLKCRLLRARFYFPIFITWWLIIIAIIGARFNSLLGGSAIRPANDAYYFFSVLRASPFIGVATIGATLAVWIMAELLDAEGRPQVNETFRQLAMDMEKDDIVRSLLGDQLRHGDGLTSRQHQVNSSRSIHMSTDTPLHASSYITNPASDMSVGGGSFFVDENNQNTPIQPMPKPLASNDSNPLTSPSWGEPSPGYQNPPPSFTQQRSPPASSPTVSNGRPNNIQSMSDFDRRAAKAEAEAFAWARQQSQHQTASGDGRGEWSSVLDEQLSRSIRTPPQATLDGIQRRVQPPASSPKSNISSLLLSGSNIGSASSVLSNSKVNVPPSFSIYNRGEGDVSHLISSDSEDDEGVGDEDRRAHAAMGLGMYEDLSNGFSNKQNNGIWPNPTSSPQLQSQSLSIPRSRSLSNSSLTRSPSNGSLEPLPVSELNNNSHLLSSSPTGSGNSLRRSNSFENSYPLPETPINMKRSASSSPKHGSYSPGSKQAAMNAASAVLQQQPGGGVLSRASSLSSSSSTEQPTSPLHPVNLASRSAFDLLASSSSSSSSSPSSSPRFTSSEKKKPNHINSPFQGQGDVRGRSEVRAPSLTRSNADSSEESEEETDDEDEDETNKVAFIKGDESVLKNNILLTNQNPPLSSIDLSSIQPNDKPLNLSSNTSEKSGDSDGSSPSSVVVLAKHGWKRFVDDSSGAPYWFNENSGESSWTKPVTTQQS